MVGTIFHATCAVIFMILSLSAGAGIVFQGDEYTLVQLLSMAGLSIASAIIWIWAFRNAGESWYIHKSRRDS